MGLMKGLRLSRIKTDEGMVVKLTLRGRLQEGRTSTEELAR
jgi:hypothetical protein